MAKKLLSEAYQEFLDGQLNKRIQDFLSSRVDDTGKIIKEGVTQADLDDWIENGIKKSFYNDLNSVQGQIHYQEDFFKQLNRNRTPLNIGGKDYMLSGNMNYEWDPDTKLFSSKVSLHPLDIPEGDKVINYKLDDWIGSSKYNIETPGVGVAYSSNLNKIINNPNISISDMTNKERSRRWTDVRNSVKDGKTFEWSNNADELLGKSQKMVRLQQGKGKHRTSRPIREPEPVGPKRGDQYYNPKTKRQFVYDGPDDIVKGGHNLISDQGHVWLSYMDELEAGPGPGRKPLDYDVVKKYNDTLTEMSVLAADRDRLQYKDPDKYFEQLQNNIKDLKRYEREVKKQIKNHRMETGDYKRMKYLESQVDRYYKDNPDKQRKQLEKQKKRAEKEVKKINKQTDKDLKKLEKKHQERKATEESKKVSQSVNEETVKAQTNGRTVEETIANTQQTVETKMDDVVTGANKKTDAINANIENVSTQAPNVMNDEYVKQAIDNEAKNIEVGTAERFDTNETFEDFYAGLQDTRADREKLNPESPKVDPEVIKTESTIPEPDVKSSRPNDHSNVVNDNIMNEAIDDAAQKAKENIVYGRSNPPKDYADLVNNSVINDGKNYRTTENAKVNYNNKTRKTDSILINGKKPEDILNEAGEKAKENIIYNRSNPPKDFADFIHNSVINEGQHYNTIENVDDVKVNYNEGTRKVDMPESPEDEARRILDENLQYQKTKNRFGNTEFSIDTDGGPMVTPADMPSGANYNPNRNLDNGYKIKEIQSVSDDGSTIITNSNYTNRNVVPPAGGGNGGGGGGNKGPRGVNSANNGPGSGNFSTSKTTQKVSKLDQLKNMSFMEKVMTAGNIVGAVADYKEARREGHGVVSSALRAGAEFALSEALGYWYFPYLGVKYLPKGIIKGTEALYKENRRMNSAANNQVFGTVQFQDTQQLATMRQSGMEMAKMAQYNLQQTLMGQEATYLHR